MSKLKDYVRALLTGLIATLSYTFVYEKNKILGFILMLTISSMYSILFILMKRITNEITKLKKELEIDVEER